MWRGYRFQAAIGLLFLLCSYGGISSCARSTSPAPTSAATSVQPGKTQDALIIYVTNYPLKYFAERIAGDTAQIEYLIPDEIDPAFWKPESADIAQMQTGDLIFLNGASYEKWLPSASLPDSKLVDTSASFRDHLINLSTATTHSHGPEGEHAHTGTAFATWLNFEHAIAQADAIRTALAQARPQQKDTFQSNFQDLRQDLQAIDQQLQTITATNPDIPIVASHPVYDYLAQRYGLNLTTLIWEPDELPNEVQWQELKTLLKKHPAQWILWESEPHPETVAKLKAIAIESIVFNPISAPPTQGNFVEVMQQNIQSLQTIYQKAD